MPFIPSCGCSVGRWVLPKNPARLSAIISPTVATDCCRRLFAGRGETVTISEPEGTMGSNTEHNAACGCGSGKKYEDCCGAPKGEVANMRVKDLNVFELTPGLADALSASLDAAYLEYFTADCSGTSTKEAERRIAAIPEGKRYLTRVLDSLDNAFADFDTETAMLDLPHMQKRKPEAIKRYLEFRLRQFKMLLDAVEDYVGEKYPSTGGHS